MNSLSSTPFPDMDLQFLYSGGGSLHSGTALVNELGPMPFGGCLVLVHAWSPPNVCYLVSACQVAVARAPFGVCCSVSACQQPGAHAIWFVLGGMRLCAAVGQVSLWWMFDGAD
eukprot:1153420-Pelagomonas_calceolata.AAC.7